MYCRLDDIDETVIGPGIHNYIKHHVALMGILFK